MRVMHSAGIRQRADARWTALFGVPTASFASILVRRDDRSSTTVTVLVKKMRSMRESLAELNKQHPRSSQRGHPACPRIRPFLHYLGCGRDP